MVSRNLETRLPTLGRFTSGRRQDRDEVELENWTCLAREIAEALQILRNRPAVLPVLLSLRLGFGTAAKRSQAQRFRRMECPLAIEAVTAEISHRGVSPSLRDLFPAGIFRPCERPGASFLLLPSLYSDRVSIMGIQKNISPLIP